MGTHRTNHRSANTVDKPTVNFSLKREVFFVTIGSVVGAFTMHIPRIFSDIVGDSSYLTTLLVMADVVNSSDPMIGFILHLFVATAIGIVTGIMLHRIVRFNLSKISRGIMYGIVSGIVVFIVFAIPVTQVLLNPTTVEVLTKTNPDLSNDMVIQQIEEGLLVQLRDSFLMHLIWGIALGTISSFFTRKFGANYLCHVCNIEFSKISTWEHHQKYVHDSPSPEMKKIVILGGGFAGVHVLRKVQKKFEDNVNINIMLISENNFLLFTPMLPEMATGTVEPRHISTPVRTFCKRAEFLQAKVSEIDFERKNVFLNKNKNKKSEQSQIAYDYLVISLGSRTNFFGNKEIQQNSLSVKTMIDAIKIRNHVIECLESAEHEKDKKTRKELLTFVVVGGGFSGVETIGELNDFLRESVSKFYRRIKLDELNVMLVAADKIILPEVGEVLGKYAKDTLEKNNVTIITGTKATNVGDNFVETDNNEKIFCNTIIWAAGLRMDPVFKNFDCKKDDQDKIKVNQHLQLENYPDVFAIGDCASIQNSDTGEMYPPTAQHAIAEAEIAAKNLILLIDSKNKPLSVFSHSTKGTMAKIGQKNAVAIIFGNRLKGLMAWFVWKQYYISAIPTLEKKIRIGVDWFLDLFSHRDITRLNNYDEKQTL
ncbi:NAD(P)/FAD-dependent oxidoreductase [Nitrosopumilus sp.]|uniref:NAD(P)/FAD-dependent oxidoreductase n=1 Tax=Nitrosopumilus sp. TaxID=2024843 RepID=UPI003B5B74B5